MATKEAVFSLRVDTGNSVQDIQNADTAVKNFNKDLQATQATAASGTGISKMQTDLATLNEKVTAGGMTMRDMTQAMKQYQNIAAQAGAQSPVGQQALSAAAQLKDELGDLRSVTGALSSDFVGLDTTMQGIETGAAVFQGLQGAIALAGIENEDLEKTMVKLQATQGVVNAVNTVAKNLNKDAILGIQLRIAAEKIQNFIQTGSFRNTLLTTEAKVADTAATVGQGTAMVATSVATTGATLAAKALRIALISTGVGALIVGLGLLIANFDIISKGVLKARDQFEKFGLGAKIAIGIIALAIFPIGAIIYGVIKALEYFGVVDDVATKRNKENAQARTKAIEKEANRAAMLAKQKQKSDDDKYTQEIALAKAAGKATYEMELLKAKAHLASGRVFLQEQNVKIKGYKAEIELLIATGDADSDRVKSLKKSLSAAKTLATESYKDNVSTKNALAVMEVEHATELANNAKAAGKDSSQKQAELNKAKLDAIKSHLQREIQATEDSENLKISEMADGQAKTIATLQDTYGDWRNELIRKASETELKALDEKFAKGKMSEEEYRQSLQDIMSKGVKNLTGEELKLMGEKEAQLAEGIRRAKLTAEQRELEDVASFFKQQIDQANAQGEEGKSAALKLVVDEEIAKAKIRKKYADLALEEAARQEAIRREKTKFVNSLIKTDAEIALQELNFQQIDAKKELLRLLSSENKSEQITQEEFDAAMIALHKKKIAGVKQINIDAAAATKAAEVKAREEELAGITAGIAQAQAALDNIKMVNDLLNEIGTTRINKINEERDEDLANLDEKQKAELSAVGLTADQKTAIEEKFAKQKYEVQLAAFNQEDKINRAKFNRDKAIKLAEVGINTATAIVKGIAEFGPPPSPAGIAAILSAGIIGTTQALAIANQKYQGGTMPTMPSVSGGGGLAGSSASSFTSQPTTQTSTTGLNDNGQSITAPVQVFVLENDISSTQNKVAVQESKSSF
jgi:hypothetical protein